MKKNFLEFFFIAISAFFFLLCLKISAVGDAPPAAIDGSVLPLVVKEGKHPHQLTIKKDTVIHSVNFNLLKTGDLLFICYGDFRTVFSSVFYNSLWTHVAIYYRDVKTDEPYVFEASEYKPPYSSEIVRIPLLNWLRINRNAKHIAVLPMVGSPIDINALEKSFILHENKKVLIQGLSLKWVKFLFKKRMADFRGKSFFNSACTDGRRPADITCHELVISVLQDTGVLSKEYTPCSFLPNSIIKGDIQMENGYRFGELYSLRVGKIFKFIP